MRVVIAPDSFKGSASALQVADALKRGWLSTRPEDAVVTLPLADGGEGTLEAIQWADPSALIEFVSVDGPSGRANAPWLLRADGTAVVELAAACGLPLWPRPDPLKAHTFALGQVLRAAAADRRVRRMVVALGGSASTDGGTGALTALGARFTNNRGGRMPLGVDLLEGFASVQLSHVQAPPREGVEILVDVDAPLLGSSGAAMQFGPQKGANPDEVLRLDAALARLADHLGGSPDAPGAGAAGGTGYGLATAWGARLVSGSQTIADLVGLDRVLEDADLVITGEGRLDEQSLNGKVVGHVVGRAQAHQVAVAVVVGSVQHDTRHDFAGMVELAALAGSMTSAIADPTYWLCEAGRRLAESQIADR